ncbi:equilibrative nucleoside transporter 1 [Chrysoperla carnea]|uniref:equilibrative nucleoside transporter 1 n=1 Tax=Chrysoperla carnea TaxID=189513 RepID=UPI001D066F7B|nr:equilibrative nucleoside transporter 1 [Chrysoperla carnea]
MSLNTSKNSQYENEHLIQNKRNGTTITTARVPRENDHTTNSGTGADSEKQAFLSTEPVRLTPAWEEVNVPDDELNFRTISTDQANLEMNPPKDRLNLVYWVILLHGIGILTPWNMFITAKEYFVDYKLSKEYTGEESMYGTNFLSYVGFAAQVPGLILNWGNIFINIGGNLTKRIVYSITALAIIFLITILLAMFDTSKSPGFFFFATMTCVVILNSANGIYQSSVFGLAATLPSKYSGAVILGCNICGTITTLISILTNTLTSNKRTAAIYYFITALFILLVAFDTYFALPLNRFYRYHKMINERESKKHNRDNQKTKIPYFKVYTQAFPQLFNVFFVYFVTLSVFPAMHADIKMSDPNFFVPQHLYTLITCFLTFNVTAMIGSSLVSFFTWPSPKYLFIPVILRALYIPLFIFMNYHPKNIERNLPVYIDNDWAYWIIAITLGLTSGYFGALAMMYVPRKVDQQYSGTAGMFGSAMLVSGILCGVLFSFLGPPIVSRLPI